MIRVFVGIGLSDDACQRISSLQQQLKKILPPVDWVQPASLHLTVKFLGSVESLHISKILSVLKPIGDDIPQFSLDLMGVGVFPKSQQPRVIWVGIVETTQYLRRLGGCD